MSCIQVRKLISEFLDQRLAGEQRDYVSKHMAFCRECSTQMKSMAEARSALRALPPRPVPARLAGQLRVLASHEHARRLAGGHFRSQLLAWKTRFDLAIENLMRPLALPFAGGLLSALVMFSMLVPTLNFRHNFRGDIPILSTTYTPAALEEISPFCLGTEDSVVELTIDEKGNIADYRVSEGRMTKELANDLLFSRFSPATMYGRPIAGKFYLTFRRGHTFVVKG
jgi:hypothetical protein